MRYAPSTLVVRRPSRDGFRKSLGAGVVIGEVEWPARYAPSSFSGEALQPTGLRGGYIMVDFGG